MPTDVVYEAGFVSFSVSGNPYFGTNSVISDVFQRYQRFKRFAIGFRSTSHTRITSIIEMGSFVHPSHRLLQIPVELETTLSCSNSQTGAMSHEFP